MVLGGERQLIYTCRRDQLDDVQHYPWRGQSRGESGDVSTETVESWLEHLPSNLTGYEAQHIWN